MEATSPMRALVSPLLLSTAWLLTACATPQNPDPLEALNQKTFAFNEGVDKMVMKPVAQAPADRAGQALLILDQQDATHQKRYR